MDPGTLFFLLGVLSIPITAITGSYIYKIKKLKALGGMSTEERRKLIQLAQENEELKQRLENVEMIVASADIDLITSSASTESIKELKDTISRVQQQNDRFKLH